MSVATNSNLIQAITGSAEGVPFDGVLMASGFRPLNPEEMQQSGGFDEEGEPAEEPEEDEDPFFFNEEEFEAFLEVILEYFYGDPLWEYGVTDADIAAYLSAMEDMIWQDNGGGE
ncbi:MAG: hypothetical protein AAF483_14140 [Planctomycetota bacterium]